MAARKKLPADPAPDTANPATGIMVGYARVSMSDQNNQRQKDELTKFGVDPRDIFEDHASGRNMLRPGWQALWRDIQAGDLLVVHALDRLGRSIVDIIHTIEELERRGVGLKVLSMDIDTRTPIGKFVLHVMAAFAQMERELIVERTNHGLAKARERGVIGGRPQKITREQVEGAIARVNAGTATVKDIAAEYGVHRNALQRRMEALRKARREGKAK